MEGHVMTVSSVSDLPLEAATYAAAATAVTPAFASKKYADVAWALLQFNAAPAARPHHV
jgi:hypothetical protein